MTIPPLFDQDRPSKRYLRENLCNWCSDPCRLCLFGDRLTKSLVLLADINVVQPSRVLAKNLLLHLQGERTGFRHKICWQLEIHELIYYPFWLPKRVVAAEKNAVRSQPEEELADNLTAVTGTGMDQGDRHGKPRVHIRFLCRDERKIVEPRQPTMFDDKIQIRKKRCHFVDVGDIESILIQWANRRAFMHMNIF